MATVKVSTQSVPPSPTLLSAPIPLTPGPLATRLSELFISALNSTLKSCSYPNFAACFPTPAVKRPEVLKSVWSQVIGKVETKAQIEFETILKERDVIAGLNGLEAVLGRARERKALGGDEKPIAPHTLSPEVLYLATLSPHLAPIADELTMKLKAQRERNEELLSGIQNQRAEIEQLVTGLEAVVTDLEGAVDTVQSASNEFDNADEMEGIENGRSRL